MTDTRMDAIRAYGRAEMELQELKDEFLAVNRRATELNIAIAEKRGEVQQAQAQLVALAREGEVSR